MGERLKTSDIIGDQARSVEEMLLQNRARMAWLDQVISVYQGERDILEAGSRASEVELQRLRDLAQFAVVEEIGVTQHELIEFLSGMGLALSLDGRRNEFSLEPKGIYGNADHEFGLGLQIQVKMPSPDDREFDISYFGSTGVLIVYWPMSSDPGEYFGRMEQYLTQKLSGATLEKREEDGYLRFKDVTSEHILQ